MVTTMSPAAPATAHTGSADAPACDFDVLIVGAGISGVAAAYHLQKQCPLRSYAILERRHAIGGTWDLFRYPGIRSDSDMFTLGYSFRPWDSNSMISDGAAIREYVAGTADQFGIAPHIRYGHSVTEARWSSGEARWEVSVAVEGIAEVQRMRCRFLAFCSGYYDYEQGFDPQWPGREGFRGPIVHPQHWPADLEYAGRKVVIIGSGATAVTLVPELARQAAHVTMLQRSPSYVMALPSHDAIAAVLRRWLPRGLAHGLVRWKNILAARWLYRVARRRPDAVRRFLLKAAQRQLGPAFDVGKHLNPSYQPWDQRLCIAPDADLFKAIRSGKADIVTDTIDAFTPDGIRLASGAELAADLIVTATGLKVQLLGGARLVVDGQPVSPAQTLSYKGLMYSGVPNLVSVFGYTNASWTLKAELIARYMCRVLNHMAARGLDVCVPVSDESPAATGLAIELSSGYIQRAAAVLPRQAGHKPWRMNQDYLQDLRSLRFARLDDGALRFGRRGHAQPASVPR
jgi:cation diffusion facilitator CzcD-associated flavoprotein CzcO